MKKHTCETQEEFEAMALEGTIQKKDDENDLPAMEAKLKNGIVLAAVQFLRVYGTGDEPGEKAENDLLDATKELLYFQEEHGIQSPIA